MMLPTEHNEKGNWCLEKYGNDLNSAHGQRKCEQQNPWHVKEKKEYYAMRNQFENCNDIAENYRIIRIESITGQ